MESDWSVFLSGYRPIGFLPNFSVVWTNDDIILLNLTTGEGVVVDVPGYAKADLVVPSFDGRWLALVDFASVDIYDLATFERLTYFSATHEITAMCWSYDGAMLATADTNAVAQVWVNVNDPSYDHPPRVTLASPGDGSTVSNTIAINGTAWDDHRLDAVLVRVDDGAWEFAEGTEDWIHVWDTRFTENGWHRVSARAFDSERFSHVASVGVLVRNDGTTRSPPNVTIDEPDEGDLASGAVRVAGRAWGVNAVTRVLLTFLGSEASAAPVEGTWSVEVDTTRLPNGTVRFEGRAFDGLHWSEPAVVNLTVHNNVTMPNRPPVVLIHSLVEGGVYSSTLLARGTAADEERELTFVAVRLDGSPWRMADKVDGTFQEWRYEVDTWELENGPHLLSALSLDDEQLSAVVEVPFVVENDWDYPRGRPRCQVTSPANGSLVEGVVTVEGTASDDVEVRGVVVRYDGAEHDATLAEGNWSLPLDTLGLPNGPLLLEVWSHDGTRASNIVVLSLEVSNDRPPHVIIDWPLEDRTVLGIVDVVGRAGDPEDSTVTVELRVDGGEWRRCQGGGEWTYAWNTSGEAPGVHSIEARAFDGSLFSDVASVDVNVTGSGNGSPAGSPGSTDYTLMAALVLAVAVVTGSVVYWFQRRGDR